MSHNIGKLGWYIREKGGKSDHLLIIKRLFVSVMVSAAFQAF